MLIFSLPRYCRKERLSYQALAQILKISESYACQLRLGRVPLTLPIARRLRDAIGLPLDVLFNGDRRERRSLRVRTTRKAAR